MIKTFLSDQSGASAVEYGLIAALLSLAVVAGVGAAAESIAFMFSDTDSKLQQAFQ